MRNELQQHKKSDKIKWIATALAVVMLGVGVTAAITKGFKDWNPYGWFDKKTEQTTPETPPDNTQGAIIGESKGNGIKLTSKTISPADYAANGVSAQAESAKTLTVNYEGDITYQEVDWKIAFSNPASSWAKGKTVTDYVTVTPTSDGALTATVANLAAFGEQIVITATNRATPSSTASVTVDYAKRAVQVRFSQTYSDSLGTAVALGTSFSSWTLDLGTATTAATASTFEVFQASSTGTVEDTFTITSKEISLDNVWVERFTAYAKTTGYYTSNNVVKAVIDSLSSATAQTFTDSLSLKDFSSIMATFVPQIADSIKTTANRRALCAIHAAYYASSANQGYPYTFILSASYSGTYSSGTMSCYFGYSSSAFGTAATNMTITGGDMVF